MSKSQAQLTHEARIAAMRQEHADKMRTSRIEHEKVMGTIKAKMVVVEQRNLEWLIAWLEQQATPAQVVTIISRINQGEW